MTTTLPAPPQFLLVYQVFMIRLWRDKPDGPLRVSLQTAENGERRIFPDLETPFAYRVNLAEGCAKRSYYPPWR